MGFLEKLDAAATKNNSLVCVGLDTDATKIPPHLLTESNPVLAFNKRIIDSTADLVQAYKLNLAFYEALGSTGYETMKRTLEVIPNEIPVIGDAKRGDIGNTASLYAKALFDDLGFDAVTLSPYMGYDSIEPFLRYEERGVFVLVLTSNSGSRDFQYLKSGDEELYIHVARKVVEWNDRKNCGMVVGATHPQELQTIRSIAGRIPILVPGLGAQGGDVESSVQAGIDEAGMRAIFNSSRAILFASSERDYGERAREKTLEFRNEINTFRQTVKA